MLLFETTRSAFPSPFRSPMATDVGDDPTANGEPVGAWKVPSPFPSRMETLFPPLLTTATSALPSPLKSPAATEIGLVPAPTLVAPWNPDEPTKAAPTCSFTALDVLGANWPGTPR